MVPLAQIVHSSPRRLRLRIAGSRGDVSYFAETSQKLTSAFAKAKVQANALTGSIVLTGDGVDVAAVSDFGRSQGLFRVQAAEPGGKPLLNSIVLPLQAVDRNVRAATSGRMDLPGTLFVALLLFGIVELIKGNFRSPPWYTAFWYAFGLYSKVLFDQVAALNAVDARDA
jgi:hypothetical protein